MIVCTRRRALLLGGAFAASGPLASLAQALPRAEHAPLPGARLYAVLQAEANADASIAHFVWSGAAWQQRQSFAATTAGPLLASVDRQQIFVAHAAQDARQAAGTVETLHVDAHTGWLTRGVRQALALSARVPSAMALTPNGRRLAVAAAGGVLSLLPVSADGSVGEVIAAHKHLAFSRQTASPACMTFHSATELHIACGAQTLRFHCGEHSGDRGGEPGFQSMGMADVRPARPASASHAIPLGVVSSVLLPPLSV